MQLRRDAEDGNVLREFSLRVAHGSCQWLFLRAGLFRLSWGVSVSAVTPNDSSYGRGLARW